MMRQLGIRKAIMTTIHAYTSSQSTVDMPSKKIRRGKTGAANFVPTSAGAAIATTRVLTSLEGNFDGVAVRGPIPAGSLADMVFVTTPEATVEEVNRIFQEEAAGDQYAGILAASDAPLVSSDPRRGSIEFAIERSIGERARCS